MLTLFTCAVLLWPLSRQDYPKVNPSGKALGDHPHVVNGGYTCPKGPGHPVIEQGINCLPRHGNNALGFRRHRTQIPYGSSICVSDNNPEFHWEGNTDEPATPPPQQWGDTGVQWLSHDWAGVRGYYPSILWLVPSAKLQHRFNMPSTHPSLLQCTLCWHPAWREILTTFPA